MTVEANIAAPPDTLLDTEWLLTNGLGGFAMGTASGCNTRRYHSLFTTAARPPVERFNLLSTVHETVTYDGRTIELDNHEFAADGGSVFHPGGWQWLDDFQSVRQSSCHWFYRVGPYTIIRRLELVWRRPLAMLSYELSAERMAGPMTLRIWPLTAMRDFHHHRRADAAPTPTVEVNDTLVRLRVANQPTLHLLAESGRFVQQHDWWRNFRHRRESERGQDDTEDLFTPGFFEFEFDSARSTDHHAFIHIGAEPIDIQIARRNDHRHELLDTIRDAVLQQAPDADEAMKDALSALTTASNDFIVQRTVDERPSMTILAGYPWFADWGRDTMIALPGLLLCTRRFDDAASTLSVFARHIRRGLVPNRFDDYGGEAHYNTVDASLWFVHAALEYRRLSNDAPTWRDVLAPACAQIIEAYCDGTDFDIRMDADGLITAGNPDTQLTWMDAARDGVTFTPRWGKAVEINALWHRALSGYACAVASSEPESARQLNSLADRAAASFIKVFWDKHRGHLIDHVNADHVDASLRPNQVLAVSLPDSPLPVDCQQRVMRTVRRKLLTPRGLRTLPTDDSNYHGRYAGSMFERDRAYHQGTVWAWLIGPYIEGWLRAHAFSSDARKHARQAIAPLLEELNRHNIGQLHEVFDGDAPHNPGGCIAQAWSVAEVLRSALLIESKPQEL